jgi:hypothetical protein
MKQWLAMFAVVAFLMMPVLVSANDDTKIPPEANWSATPPTPGVTALSQPRVVSTEQAQASDSVRSALQQAKDEDAKYQQVNRTVDD